MSNWLKKCWEKLTSMGHGCQQPLGDTQTSTDGNKPQLLTEQTNSHLIKLSQDNLQQIRSYLAHDKPTLAHIIRASKALQNVAQPIIPSDLKNDYALLNCITGESRIEIHQRRPRSQVAGRQQTPLIILLTEYERTTDLPRIIKELQTELSLELGPPMAFFLCASRNMHASTMAEELLMESREFLRSNQIAELEVFKWKEKFIDIETFYLILFSRSIQRIEIERFQSISNCQQKETDESQGCLEMLTVVDAPARRLGTSTLSALIINPAWHVPVPVFKQILACMRELRYLHCSPPGEDPEPEKLTQMERIRESIHGPPPLRSMLSPSQIGYMLRPVANSLVTLELLEFPLVKWLRHDGTRLDLSAFTRLENLSVPSVCIFGGTRRAEELNRNGLYPLLPRSLKHLEVVIGYPHRIKPRARDRPDPPPTSKPLENTTPPALRPADCDWLREIVERKSTLYQGLSTIKVTECLVWSYGLITLLDCKLCDECEELFRVEGVKFEGKCRAYYDAPTFSERRQIRKAIKPLLIYGEKQFPWPKSSVEKHKSV